MLSYLPSNVTRFISCPLYMQTILRLVLSAVPIPVLLHSPPRNVNSLSLDA